MLFTILAGAATVAGIRFWQTTRPQPIYGLANLTPAEARSVTHIDGVTIYRYAFKLVCDPSSSLPANQGCSTRVHQLRDSNTGVIYLHFGGLTLAGIQRLCRDGYHFWVSDNQGSKSIFSPDPNAYRDGGAAVNHVRGSFGDVCDGVLTAGPTDYIDPNLNERFVATGPWVITYELYSPEARLLLTSAYKTMVIP